MKSLLSPSDVLQAVQWPKVHTPKVNVEEVNRFRKQLVYVLVDRANRSHATSENVQALRALRAKLGLAHFANAPNPDYGQYKECLGTSTPKPLVQDLHVRAVEKVITALRGEAWAAEPVHL